ncbi:glycoside hydrolase family 18 protein [Gonapodya prolifera JEL478]|uniref:Glycoside hydrolase family 18 protein n=1 Tax=Gonapodya prolifera (strain JEL478) TaxID=1344416 RepID=A0A138ZX92_GONPJ|nr:glycoside hydrolase family 18 protein [Gonapodya prolifera JEL478]|eukprot:KXS08763.1 glycoside hydrolase family 18 protein [Gonapodya prolifera JEL478]
MRQANASVKVLLSVGGWGAAQMLQQLIGNSALMKKFAASLGTLVTELGLQGVDLDYEYPPSDDTTARQLRDWVAAVRRASPPGTLVTAAVSSDPANFPRWLDTAFDSFYIMSYDFVGPWTSRTGHNSDLAAGKACVGAWLSHGYPLSKLNLGCAAYGRSCTVQSPNGTMNGLGAEAVDGSWQELTYAQVLDMRRTGSMSVNWDSGKCAPWLWNAASKEFVTYEDHNVMRTKRIWATARGLEGVFVWCARQDTSGRLIDALCTPSA